MAGASRWVGATARLAARAELAGRSRGLAVVGTHLGLAQPAFEPTLGGGAKFFVPSLEALRIRVVVG